MIDFLAEDLRIQNPRFSWACLDLLGKGGWKHHENIPTQNGGFSMVD